MSQSPSPLQIIDNHDQFTQADLPAVLREWLQRCLAGARYPRLDQAGYAHTRLALAQVFIDVEVGGSAGGAAASSAAGSIDKSDKLDPGIVATLLGQEPMALEPRSQVRGEAGERGAAWEPGENQPGQSQPGQSQVVLIGGPGQGKSTVTQYLAQIHRAALLRGSAADEQTRAIVDEIAQHVAAEMPGWPVQPCLPATIALGELAAWMVNKSVAPERAVTGFLCEEIGKPLGTIPETDLHALLELVPWLVIFDGLDEVPASGGRDLVMAAIQWFRGLLMERRTRVLMLATTRPQGYADELGAHLATGYLQPLSKKRALAYARKLIDLRYLPDERDVLYGRMEEACNATATARLMESPLQVTIMAALVNEVGRPPHQRWRLFGEYYRVIYQREMQRPNSPAARLLLDHRDHIDKIHRQVGLLLQVESERTGGTEALLDAEQLMAVVERHLHEEGFAEDERAALARDMVEVATDRLVFLVSPQQDRYGFEIRSLQEFMAAEALMDGRDEVVQERLRRIAPLYPWRNVLLFAAGKCASQQRHLRDFLASDLLDSLERTGNPVLDSTPRASAELAVDLIEDGSFDSAPAHLERLAGRAVELLALPFGLVSLSVDRLVLLPQDKVRAEVRRFFETRWQGEFGGWRGLLVLASGGEAWARELAEKHWPAGEAQEPGWLRRMLGFAPISMSEWLAGQILASLESIDHAALQIVFAIGDGGKEEVLPGSARARLAAIEALGWRSARAQIEIRGSDLGADMTVLENPRLKSFDLEAFGPVLQRPGMWQPWISAVRFSREPTHERLALELEALAGSAGMTDVEVLLSLPWPLGACLAQAGSNDDLRVLARRARAGELGQTEGWRAAEHQWRTQGIAPADLSSTARQWPGCGLVGGFVPHPGVLRFLVYSNHEPQEIEPLFRGFVRAYQEQSMARSGAARIVWRLLNMSPSMLHQGILSAETLGALVQDLPSSEGPWSGLFFALFRQARDDVAWFEVIERLVRRGIGHWYVPDVPTRREIVALLGELYRSHPTSHAIPVLLAHLAIGGHTESEPYGALFDLSTMEDPVARYHAGLWNLFEDTLGLEDARVWIREVAREAAQGLWLLVRALDRQLDRVLGAGDRARAEREQRVALAIELLTVVYEHVPDDKPGAKALLLAAIHRHRSHCPSGLERDELWNQLGLPAPAPSALSRAAGRAAAGPDMLARHRIEHMAIRNLRCIADITVDLPTRPDDADRGRWIVLVGENGAGKSSILRGLVLALAAPDVAAGLVADSSTPLVRTGNDAAEIHALIRGATFRAKVRVEKGREELVRFKDQTQAERPWLFAYGCGRGSALGGPDREVSYTETASVITLFDETASLLSAETWLKLLQLDALKSSDQHKDRLDMVLDTLKAVLPGVEDIDIDGAGVWLSGASVGQRTPLSGLSDGYLTTIGWVTDFLARWLHRAALLSVPITRDVPGRMEALVLVDEIDLHLHPRWQRDIIGTLRNIFPRVSFVVTTHNPLTLLGARAGEIFVVRRAPAGEDRPGGGIEVVPCDPPEGVRADQVLTGQWFGLASTLDPGTLELLEKHRQMLRQKVPDGAPARQELEEQIRGRLGQFAETPLEALAQEVVAEVMEAEYARRTPAERLALRARFKDMLSERRQRRDRGEE